MNLLNQHNLIGYIQTDTELKEGSSGKNYLNILLNIEDHYRKKDDFIKNYQSIPMVSFGKMAEQLSERTVKGQKILIQFKIVSQSANHKDSNWVIPQLVIQRFETLESKERAIKRIEERNEGENNKVEDSGKLLEKESDVENDIPEELNPLNNYHAGYQLREIDYR